MEPPMDIQSLHDQFEAVDRDARLLVEHLGEERGCWRPASGSWSVAQCFDHLAITNQIYLGAMEQPVKGAREGGRWRRGPAVPGLLGGWFAKTMEPPVRASFRMKAPRKIEPERSLSLEDAFARFTASQEKVRDYLRTNADLDLAGIRFPNPLVRGIRFSLATGLHIIAAHERRHLWQAERVRRAAEAGTPALHDQGTER